MEDLNILTCKLMFIVQLVTAPLEGSCHANSVTEGWKPCATPPLRPVVTLGTSPPGEALVRCASER